jgi:hypothetical protein
LPKSPDKFSKSPGNKNRQKKFTKSPHKITKSPHNLNTYRSPDLKRRRGWRNKPPSPYKNMTHDKVEQREEYTPIEMAGEYRECMTTLPIEEQQPLIVIHDIDDIDDSQIH